MRRQPRDQAVVITDVGLGRASEFNDRRRRYSILMGGRLLCVLLAAVGAAVSLWLALAFILAAAVLPWCAVLIANDRPRKRTDQSRPRPQPVTERALPAAPADERTVDG